MVSENKPGSIEIEVAYNLDDVEARLDRIVAKLKEAVELKERLEEVNE